MKRRIRLSEQDLHRLVRGVINEVTDYRYPFDKDAYNKLVQEIYEHVEAACGMIDKLMDMTRSKEDPMKGSTYHLDILGKVAGDLLSAKHGLISADAKPSHRPRGSYGYEQDYDG